jgi:hypothetical protein
LWEILTVDHKFCARGGAEMDSAHEEAEDVPEHRSEFS